MSTATTGTRDDTTRAPRSKARLGALLVFLACLLPSVSFLAGAVRRMWPFTIDDAFITFRYARTLADTGRPTWNPGGPPVEGYTSPLHVLLMTPATWLHVDPVLWSRALAFAALAGCSALLATRVWRVGQPRHAFAYAILGTFLFANANTAVHLVSGLETALFLFATLALGLAFVQLTVQRDARLVRRSATALALTSLLAGLTRPEGNAIAGIFILAGLAALPRPVRKLAIRPLLLWYVLPGALYFAARWWYYGHLLPLPFYVKLQRAYGLPNAPSVVAFLDRYAPLLALAAILSLLDRRRRWAVVGLASATLGLLLVAARTSPIMGYEFRFAYPTAAILVSSCALLDDLDARRHAIACVFGVALLFPFGVSQLHALRSAEVWTRGYSRALASAHVSLGDRLAAVQDGPRILAIGDAGTVPFLSRWNTIDTFGLNNPFIAIRHPGNAQRATHILAHDPRALVLISRSARRPDFRFSYARALWRAASSRGMRTLAVFRFDASYFLWVLGRPDDAALRLSLQQPDPPHPRSPSAGSGASAR